MNELALGRSQFFHEQGRVVQALASELWTGCEKAREQDRAASPREQNAWQTLMRGEAERLSDSASRDAVETAALLEELRPIVESLTRTKSVSVRFDLSRLPAVLYADRVILRQALLCLVSHAINLVSAEIIEVRGFAGQSEIGLCVRSSLTDADAKPSVPVQPDQSGLAVCRQLMAAMRGTLDLKTGSSGFEARLTWPVTPPGILLVIDDNQDFVGLFRRYLAGYDWEVRGAGSAEQARQVMAEMRPTLIILDVLLPKEDGWELLMALRADDHTHDIPIIVCSVLKEPHLARSLGASAYLLKPVAQRAFLETLAPWLHPHPIPPPGC